MPKVPLIQFQVVTDSESQRTTIFALDMNGNLWRHQQAWKEAGITPGWYRVEGPDDSGEEQRQWGRHD